MKETYNMIFFSDFTIILRCDSMVIYGNTLDIEVEKTEVEKDALRVNAKCKLISESELDGQGFIELMGKATLTEFTKVDITIQVAEFDDKGDFDNTSYTPKTPKINLRDAILENFEELQKDGALIQTFESGIFEG